MAVEDRSHSMDQKPDIILFIGQYEIGRYSMPKVRLGTGNFTRKLVFHRGKYFELVSKFVHVDPSSEIITSSTGRKYNVEQFISGLDMVDEIK